MPSSDKDGKNGKNVLFNLPGTKYVAFCDVCPRFGSKLLI